MGVALVVAAARCNARHGVCVCVVVGVGVAGRVAHGLLCVSLCVLCRWLLVVALFLLLSSLALSRFLFSLLLRNNEGHSRDRSRSPAPSFHQRSATSDLEPAIFRLESSQRRLRRGAHLP